LEAGAAPGSDQSTCWLGCGNHFPAFSPRIHYPSADHQGITSPPPLSPPSSNDEASKSTTIASQMAQRWNAVVDLIHTGPWWKNRGASTSSATADRLTSSFRHATPQLHPPPPPPHLRNQWLRQFSSQRSAFSVSLLPVLIVCFASVGLQIVPDFNTYFKIGANTPETLGTFHPSMCHLTDNNIQ
jgi:hypothetical protein